ncbi:MAG TPA: permease-like cell division protein FtsX, partial [Patescibacteria group bacterium]|nr:permease-like cell division protein FtsX [Patescibacteria group bacterium]
MQNFWRNLWLSVITVFVMTLTLISMTLVVSLNVIGNEVIHAVQDKVDIDFYFYPSVQESNILKTQEYVKSISGVSSVVYVSKAEALKKFKKEHKDEPAIIASVEEVGNILPASIVVRAETIDQYPKIISEFQNSEFQKFVDQTDYFDNQIIISKITQIIRRSYEIGIGVSVIFIIISVIVIFNTIRITIYSHRE